MKKSLIIILILLIIMATMPMTVFAENGGDNGDNEETGYLTFSSDTEFSLALVKTSSYAPSVGVEYSTDAETWYQWNGTSVSAKTNNEVYKIYVRGTGNTAFADRYSRYSYFKIENEDAGVECSGNIETLLDYKAVLAGEHPEMDSYCFYRLFYNCTALTTAPELPSTNLTSYCYKEMFYGCTSLAEAPNLPATELSQGCYSYMFYGCTSLETAPELPAIELAESCYRNMFYGCTSLTEAPELPATELARICYYGMFYGCTSLTTTPELPGYGVDYCYESMFEGCTSLTVLPKLKIKCINDDDEDFRKMFYGCTGIKVSDEQGLDDDTGTLYFHEWEIWVGEKEIETDTYWAEDMLTGTGGTFTDIPEANTIYYVPHYVESAEYSSSVKYTWSEDYSSCTATLTCTCGYTNEKTCEVTADEEYYIATVEFAELYDADEETYSDDCTDKVSKSAAAGTTETTTSTVSTSTTGTSYTTETLEEEATDSEAAENTESVTGLFSNATDLASMRAAIATVKLIARSSISTAQGKQAVKIIWLIEGATYEDFDGYEIFRSIKRYSGYGKKAFFDTTKITYHNTDIKSGTKYYYKVRAYKLVDGEKLYTDWSLKAWRTV